MAQTFSRESRTVERVEQRAHDFEVWLDDGSFVQLFEAPEKGPIELFNLPTSLRDDDTMFVRQGDRFYPAGILELATRLRTLQGALAEREVELAQLRQRDLLHRGKMAVRRTIGAVGGWIRESLVERPQ